MSMLSLFLTLLIYAAAKAGYRRWSYAIFSPLVICPLLLISLLLLNHIPYAFYQSGTDSLTQMLQPATVAFAVPLYKYRHLIKEYAGELVAGVLGGSVVAILSSLIYAKWLHIDNLELLGSLAPRSITTPMAMNASQSIGGVPAMTAVFVILTGLTGILVAPLLLRVLPLKNRISQGMLLGMGAHAAGTAKAYELGNQHGAIASLTMIFAGVATLLLAPFVVPAFMQFLTFSF
ncbi:LrgB family protein [Azotosporobacter soli]|uniref:LrgB family protein n=1 Tax=Azotosporobacter soli TaxID=3055040 RepID=UPI0031FEECF9